MSTATDATNAIELFQRAICGRDELAWSEVIAQYAGLVRAWVRQHPAALRGSDDDELVWGTFERFWAAVGPERWQQFPNLASLLRYLKMCAHSAVIDNLRFRQRAPSAPMDYATAASYNMLGRLAATDLWNAIVSLLPDESERLLIYLSVVREMTPGEILRRCPQRFGSVAEVYRIKRNVLERLRRSPELQLWMTVSQEAV
jgi:DNA-directed RNA polymerase specialized sigma24 family protein